jgi:hypothetical protein
VDNYGAVVIRGAVTKPGIGSIFYMQSGFGVDGVWRNGMKFFACSDACGMASMIPVNFYASMQVGNMIVSV